MKILDTRVMRGPNCWSTRHPKLIVLRLGWQSSERDAAIKISHLVAFTALQLQREAGVDCSYAMTGSPDAKDETEAVFEYVDEKVGLLAARLATKVAESLWREERYNIAGDIRLVEEA